jgi:hypothetical protein
MAKLTKQSKFEIFTVVAVIILSIYFFVFFGNMSKEVPIDLSINGSVTEFAVRAHYDDSYVLSLVFGLPDDRENTQEEKDLKKFVGNYDSVYEDRTGTMVPLKVNIYRLEGKNRVLVKEEIYKTRGSDGGAIGSVEMYREINSFKLWHGKYLIKIETLEGFEYLKDITTTVSFVKYQIK